MNGHLKEYLLHTLPQKEQWMIEMEKHALEDRIPIMEPISMNFLLQMVRMIKPKRILEIGTAIGYSALMMHSAYQKAQIVTIERDPSRYKDALQYIENANKQNQIKVVLGDALEELKEFRMHETMYDLIFIDAAKSQYKRFFELSNPLLNKDGIIVSDNVLFKGYVAKQTGVSNRFSKIAKKIHHYNEWLVNHPDFI